MLLKKLLFSLILLFGMSPLYGGHETGGMLITYKSLASGGNPLQYEIKAYAVYELGGPSPPAGLTFQLQSSCFPTSNTSLARQNNSLIPITGVDYCTSANPATPTKGLAIYKGITTVPGICSDFKFVINSGFGRYNSTANIAISNTSDFFYILLNNTNGPNSSPEVDVSEMLQAACLNKPLNLYGFNEPDGDSLYFSPSVPQYISSGTVNNQSYKPGYSITNQVGSTVGFTVNPLNGSLQTELTSAGTFAITIKFEEYTTDTATSSMVLVGEGRYTMILYGSTNCYTPPFNLQLPAAPKSDSLACGTNSIISATSRKLMAASISADGSDFRAISKRKGSLNISSALALNDSLIQINFSQALASNDTIIVYTEKGTDNDVIFSHCGQEMTAKADTLSYYTTISVAPVAAFSYTISNLNASFSIGGSGVSADSLIWNFGDGSPLSHQPNPSHNYASGGTYTVQLIVFNQCGETDTIARQLTVCDILSAAFSHTVSGDTVYVNAVGSSGANGYIWYFGDGSMGTGQQSSHYYSVAGTYLISLQVFNACGDTAIISDSVKVCENPQAWWTYTIVSSSSSGMVVQFDGTASINAQSFEWNFGDGNSNNSSATPLHTYATPSLSYQVSLKVENSCSETHSYTYRLNQIGMEEKPSAGQYIVFPNPAGSYIKLDCSNCKSAMEVVHIYDLMGRLVLEKNLAANITEDVQTIYLPPLEEGVYMLVLKGKNISSKQILKIK